MLGFHKDFLAVSHLDSQQEDTPVVCETKHKDRVLINQPKHAIFFLNILDSPPTEKNRKNLTQSEFSSLKASLSNEGFHSLADLLTHLNSGHTRICPEAYRAFLSELARNSPACGLLQLGCTGITEETKQILEHVSRGYQHSRLCQFPATSSPSSPCLSDNRLHLQMPKIHGQLICVPSYAIK